MCAGGHRAGRVPTSALWGVEGCQESYLSRPVCVCSGWWRGAGEYIPHPVCVGGVCGAVGAGTYLAEVAPFLLHFDDERVDDAEELRRNRAKKLVEVPVNGEGGKDVVVNESRAQVSQDPWDRQIGGIDRKTE